MNDGVIRRAVAAKRLFEVRPCVYSVIPPEFMSAESWHAAAILAGGEGACLYGPSAAWWLELTPWPPAVIHVAVRSDLKPIAGIQWHRPTFRGGDTIRHRRMPCTSVHRTLLDIAITYEDWPLRRALANAEYHHDVEAHELATRRGHRGSKRLAAARQSHIPQLAETRSHLEDTFIALLHDHRFAIPEINHPVGLSTVDATWFEPPIAVELDGVKGHSGERRVLRDHRRDLHRRREGFTPLRYHFTQLVRDANHVAADLARARAPRLTAR